MTSRDLAVLDAVRAVPGADYARIRSAYERRTGRRLSCSAAIACLRRLSRLKLIVSEARQRASPIFYPSGRSAAS